MKTIRQVLASAKKQDTSPKKEYIRIDRDILPGFTEWCHQYNVSILASKDSEFTVLMGDREKVVKIEHL